MSQTNTVYSRKNADGTIDYIVSLGNLIYNSRILTLDNLIIPIWGNSFFNLPSDRNKYAIVNVYYEVETGRFIFDTISVQQKYVSKSSSNILFNLVPIAQFVLKQSLSSFEVVNINEFSKMSTFTVTQTFVTGSQGIRGPIGETGVIGETGPQSVTGQQGYVGITGFQGATGVGDMGSTGSVGTHGVAPELNLIVYYKFKSDDETQLDSSLYERDLEWGATGYVIPGETGLYGETGLGGLTGVGVVSTYTKEEGIIDNCHSMVYKGGFSSYLDDIHIDFNGYTGTLQAWVRVDQIPIPQFEYAVDGVTPNKRNFTNLTRFYPDTFQWLVNDVEFSTVTSPSYTFTSPGEYVVTLKATNTVGTSEISKLLIIT